mmetsp:Transcript_90783/g.157447  ORF Transcript_90783/g.157447 Transcript_90783/m.157447 type:complete len:96 (-) Transcript_90783:1409-1696(-)
MGPQRTNTLTTQHADLYLPVVRYLIQETQLHHHSPQKLQVQSAETWGGNVFTVDTQSGNFRARTCLTLKNWVQPILQCSTDMHQLSCSFYQFQGG